MSVPIESGRRFSGHCRRPLFQTRLVPGLFRETTIRRRQKVLAGGASADDANEPITVIVNWPRLLKE